MANRHFICGVWHRALTATPDFQTPITAPQWPQHCHRPMHMLGYRQSQIAIQLTPVHRLRWLAKGARVLKHGGKKEMEGSARRLASA